MRPFSPRPNSGRKSNELVAWDSLCRFKGRRVGPNNEFPTTGNPFSLRVARVVALRDPQRRWNGSNGTGREVAWLENVQRLAGSCLDGSFGGNRTIRGPGEGESLLRRKRKSKGDEQISRRSSLYPRDLKPNGAPADPLKKRIYNLLLAEPLKDSPRYWKNIRKGGRHTDPRPFLDIS